MKLSPILALCGALALGACASTASTSLTVTQGQYAAELAFSGLDLATNTLLSAGLSGPAEHTLRVDYEAAHTALLAERAGTGTLQSLLTKISAAKTDTPSLSIPATPGS